MQKRLRMLAVGRQAHFLRHRMFATQLQGKVKQAGLLLLQQAHHRYGGVYV